MTFMDEKADIQFTKVHEFRMQSDNKLELEAHNTSPAISLDELAKRVLSPEVNRSLTNLSIQRDRLSWEFQIDKLKFLGLEVQGLSLKLRLSGWTLFFIILIVGSMLIGQQNIVNLLQLVVSAL